MNREHLIDVIVNTIKGQGCNAYSLDDRNEYYNKSKDEQFQEDIEYCASNEDDFREVLGLVLSDLIDE